MRNKIIVLTTVLYFAIQFIISAQTDAGKSLNKNSTISGSRRFNINNVSTIIWNDGKADVSSSSPSYFYPILSGHTTNYASGFLWAGYLGGTSLRMGGSAYRTTLQPGRILPNGKADKSGEYIYKAQKNYKTYSVLKEARDELTDEKIVRNNYSIDDQNWPATLGAPYDDVNKDGKYTPGIDIPGVPGADQTIWFVANDLDSTLNKNSFSTIPSGVEMQCTVWGYYQGKQIDNMIFKKYLLINKSIEKKDFKDFYITYWNDADIGGGSRDYCGCDTTLNLFYTYSSQENNAQYGSTSPATGICILQGPKIKTGNSNDIAFGMDRTHKGYKNFHMTAHYYDLPVDVDLDPDRISIPWEWYNRMQGKVWSTGAIYPNPITKQKTVFPFSGDPVSKTGWIDGNPYAFGDRRNGGACGPFNFAYGDTQEVVIAQITAGATTGINNIGAVALLKDYTATAHKIYEFLLPYVITDVKKDNLIPQTFSLSQNYPNPFNPSTTIKYSIPNNEFVTIKIFEMLGREVTTLVNEEKSPGNYEVKFDGSNLSTGIYFYSMITSQGSFSKKMLLIK